MVGKAPIYILTSRKAPETQQICYCRHATKTSGPFLFHDKGVGFSSRNNFANLASFAKVSVPLHTVYNSLLYTPNFLVSCHPIGRKKR